MIIMQTEVMASICVIASVYFGAMTTILTPLCLSNADLVAIALVYICR